MEIKKTVSGTKMHVAIDGRLDTVSAPELEKRLKDGLTGIEELELDFQKVDFIASAGLRVLLSAQKIMNKQGKMVIYHVNENVMKVLELTGMRDILTIK